MKVNILLWFTALYNGVDSYDSDRQKHFFYLTPGI